MAQSRFLIAPLQSGLETDVKPWLIPDDAFSLLNNAYIFRGRVRKRVGSYPMNNASIEDARTLSRLRIKVGATDGAGDLSVTVPGAIFKVGQSFSVGLTFFTVNVTGTPATLLVDGTGSATFDTTSGDLEITGSEDTEDVYFYPAEPVMGLISYENPAINFEPVIGFDTQFAYAFSGGWYRLGTAVWTGDDSQLFWGYSYRGASSQETYLFVTNYNEPDNIKYLDGSTWHTINPEFNASHNTIETCRLVLPFKDRLLFMNTIEKISGTSHTYVNRCRFSQNGNPVSADAWREDIVGRGGYLDAPTKEAIISAEFLKDRLIVFFERSTWELVYTGNEVLPFRWQQVNTELGVESTFSVVPFDKIIFGIGNVGVHACNGINVERIDQKIPEEIFKIRNEDEGVERVYGIRDYYDELVYWAIPSSDLAKYPSRILVYNYRNNSWAYNDDSVTCFGYFQSDDRKTWARTPEPWEECIFTWDSGEEIARNLSIVAGNQQGFTFVMSPSITRNSPSLMITDWVNDDLTIINHNLLVGMYLYIENVYGTPFVARIESITGDVVTIDSSIVGTYEGGATVALITPIDIKTKQYNFFKESGRNFTINKAEMLIDSTALGKVSVDYSVASGRSSISTTILDTYPYPIYPMESEQDRLWHPVYISADGSFIQLNFYLDDLQTRDINIAHSSFVLHAMLFHASQTSSYIT